MGHPDGWREKKCPSWERYGYFLELHIVTWFVVNEKLKIEWKTIPAYCIYMASGLMWFRGDCTHLQEDCLVLQNKV